MNGKFTLFWVYSTGEIRLSFVTSTVWVVLSCGFIILKESLLSFLVYSTGEIGFPFDTSIVWDLFCLVVM